MMKYFVIRSFSLHNHSHNERQFISPPGQIDLRPPQSFAKNMKGDNVNFIIKGLVGLVWTIVLEKKPGSWNVINMGSI